MRSLHTADALQEWAAVHLFYELEQLVACVVPSVFPEVVTTVSGYDVFVSNALFESHLSHLRGLDDFLRLDHEDDPKTGKPRCRGDVLAVDYLPSYSPSGLLTGRERHQINVRLHHVSVERTLFPKPWDWGETTVRALGRFRAFVEEAERPGASVRIKRPEYLRRALENATDTLARFGVTV